MAKAKLTPAQWIEARREWESNPTASYATVAANFMISKALVGQRAASEKWQRGIGIALHPNANVPEGQSEKLQYSRDSGPMDVSLDAPVPSGKQSRVVADVFVPPTPTHGVHANRTPNRNAYADEIRIPDGLDEIEREEFVKSAIVARQRAINARHLKEMQAARSKLYESLKKAGTKDGPGAALACQRNVAALLALQEGETDAELTRVKLEVAEFVGKPLKPTPCRIVVHLREGGSLLGGRGLTDVYGRNVTVVTDVDAMEVPNA